MLRARARDASRAAGGEPGSALRQSLGRRRAFGSVPARPVAPRADRSTRRTVSGPGPCVLALRSHGLVFGAAGLFFKRTRRVQTYKRTRSRRRVHVWSQDSSRTCQDSPRTADLGARAMLGCRVRRAPKRTRVAHRDHAETTAWEPDQARAKDSSHTRLLLFGGHWISEITRNALTRTPLPSLAYAAPFRTRRRVTP